MTKSNIFVILVKQITLQHKVHIIGFVVMFEKNMKLAYLLDFYGDALDGRTQSIMRAYYEDDLSLSEIADGEGISRQGVRHVIKKGEEQLEFFEAKLGLATHYEELEGAVDKLYKVEQILTEYGDERSASARESIKDVITTILNKGS